MLTKRFDPLVVLLDPVHVDWVVRIALNAIFKEKTVARATNVCEKIEGETVTGLTWRP